MAGYSSLDSVYDSSVDTPSRGVAFSQHGGEGTGCGQALPQKDRKRNRIQIVNRNLFLTVHLLKNKRTGF